MSVKIRLSRVGRKNRPHWRVIAVDSRKKRDGAFLENLGSYDPIKHEIQKLHVDLIGDWVGKGAICSDAVLKLIKLKKRASGKTQSVKKTGKETKSKTKEKIEKEAES
ncbi:MAG: 30S ribosomal protein S16 [bacterium]